MYYSGDLLVAELRRLWLLAVEGYPRRDRSVGRAQDERKEESMKEYLQLVHRNTSSYATLVQGELFVLRLLVLFLARLHRWSLAAAACLRFL